MIDLEAIRGRAWQGWPEDAESLLTEVDRLRDALVTAETDRWASWGSGEYRWWIDYSVYYRVINFDGLWWCMLYCDGKEQWRKQFSAARECRDEAMAFAVTEQRSHENAALNPKATK